VIGKSSRAAGFTLLELIVAAGILALIAVFSWRGLDALIREREAIAASQEAIDILQRSFARIERDALTASDVQLDEGGTMRLVAGTSSVDGVAPATVEYRFVGGTLTRTIVGIDRSTQILFDNVATLAMEAWAPTPRGGSWVRNKGAAMELAPLSANGATATANLAPANNQQAQQTQNGMINPDTTPPGTTPPGTSQPNATAQPNVPGAQPSTVASVAPATGVRLTIARVDGSRIVRDFMVGGG
jgi:prepilin-type N-terminal cleavage/methylation domain-containing protein